MSINPAWQVINDIIRSLTSLRADQRGGVAVMMGLLFPVLLATLGLGFRDFQLVSQNAINAECRRRRGDCGG